MSLSVKGQSIPLFSKHLLSMYCAPEAMQGTGNTKWGRHRPCCLEGATKKTCSCKINRGNSIAWRTRQVYSSTWKTGLMKMALELRHHRWRGTSQVARHAGQTVWTQVRRKMVCPRSAGCEGQGEVEREKRIKGLEADRWPGQICALDEDMSLLKRLRWELVVLYSILVIVPYLLQVSEELHNSSTFFNWFFSLV